MSSTSESHQVPSFCESCKTDLTNEPHKDDCPIFLAQKDIIKKKEIEIEKEKAKSDAEIERAKTAAKEELKRLNDEEVARQAAKILKDKEDKTKSQLIEKILYKTKNANVEALRKMSIDNLKIFYKGVIDTAIQSDKQIEEYKKHRVRCPLCKGVLGISTSMKASNQMMSDHKKDCPKIKKNSKKKWMLLLIGLSLLVTVGASIFVSQNPHIIPKRKDSKK